MALALHRIKVYSKLAVIGIVSIAILVVVWKNADNTAKVWLWKEQEVATLWLMLVTSLTAIVTWWLLWGLRRLIAEWRELRKQTSAEVQLAEQKQLAEELAEREKRIDEKLKGSISDEADSST